MDHSAFEALVKKSSLYSHIGVIDRIVGMSIEANGPESNIGDVCEIISPKTKQKVLAEVVGFKGNKVLLTPYTETEGIGYGSLVYNQHRPLSIAVSDAMMGRIVNALGEPIDGKGDMPSNQYYSVSGVNSNPFERPRIHEKIQLGVRAIDGMMTIGKGQRMGIFAGSGVGKSTLMGMIARKVKADVNVIALVGERGREMNEFIERDLGEEGLSRSVLVVATSDQSAMMRVKCAMAATSIAEYFRDQGKDVLLMMDSLTRFAMAQREIGLSIGEAPIARGYTPSIYTTLPKLLERAGNFEKGSITGLYTVLVEGDDANEPISDTVRSIIDGHVMLSRRIAMKNHYPAIDVLASISRLMNDISDRKQMEVTGKIRNLMAVYQENQDLLLIGAYKMGSNAELDEAIKKIDAINLFLKQSVEIESSFQETYDMMQSIFA